MLYLNFTYFHINDLTVLTTHSKRLNCGQGTMGFLQSACWFVRYSVIMESRVTWDSPIPGVHPVVTVEVFFRRGDELITLPCSHEICFCKERLLLLLLLLLPPPGEDPCTFLKQNHVIFHTRNCNCINLTCSFGGKREEVWL